MLWLRLLLLAGARASAAGATLWLTLPDKSAVLSTAPVSACEAAGTAIDATIDPARAFQTIDGFGAAMTESSAMVLDRMPKAEREALLDDLMARVGVLRVPVGASDFSDGTYSCDDPPGGKADPALKSFSFERCTKSILPYLKEARRRRPGLKLVATAWSAPAWMKASGTMKGGALKPEWAGAYARYLARFASEMRKAGEPLDYMTVSNEPGFSTGTYPTMRMTAPEQARLIEEWLGPALKKERVKLLAFDHNWADVAYPLEVFASAGARRYAAGAAFHCYEGQPEQMDAFAAAHPDKEIHFTECSAGGWEKRFDHAFPWCVKVPFIGDLAHGARSVLYWNLVLDDHWGPTNDGCLDCRGVVTVSTATGAVEKTPEYYALAHASLAADPGARRVYSVAASTGLAQVAFSNPDGSLGWLALNETGGALGVRLRSLGSCLQFRLPPGAAVSLRQ